MKSIAKAGIRVISIFAVAVVSISTPVSASVSSAPSKLFKNCSDLKKTYPSGVALNRISIGNMIIEIRPKVYRANIRLDIDKDGIACENEAQQRQLTSTTTSTAPSTPAAPSGLAFTIKTPFDDTGTISWLDNSNNEEFFYISNIDPTKLGTTPLSALFSKQASNSTSAGVRKFVSGVTYCYWVMASNSYGNSAWAGPVCSNPALTSVTTTVPVTTVPKSSCPIGQIRIVPDKLWDGYQFFFNVYNETSASVVIDYVRVKFFGSTSGTSVTSSVWSQESVFELRSGWTDYRKAYSNLYFSPNGILYDASYRWYRTQYDVYQGNRLCSPPQVVIDQTVLASSK